MKKSVAIPILASLVLHALLFVSLNKDFFKTKTVYSKNLGKASIKLRLSSTLIKKIEPPKKVKAKKPLKQKKKKATQNSVANSATKKSTQGDDVLINQYLSSVRSAIAKNKYKSPMAERLKLKGSVKMQFLIKVPAIISDIKIVEPSRFKQLNDSAIQTVQNTQDIPTIPSELKLSEIPLTLVITYE